MSRTLNKLFRNSGPAVVTCILLLFEAANAQQIDRFKLVNRHNVVLRQIDPLAPLSVGNGVSLVRNSDPVFSQVLQHYFSDKKDETTLRLLRKI